MFLSAQIHIIIPFPPQDLLIWKKRGEKRPHPDCRHEEDANASQTHKQLVHTPYCRKTSQLRELVERASIQQPLPQRK